MEEIRGKAPLRVSFAGGGTDLNEVFEKYGGAVINTTINKYIHMTLIPRNNKIIRINDSSELDDFSQQIIQGIYPSKGFDIFYHTDLPSGRGLGSSSTYSVLLAKLIYEYLGTKISNEELVKQVYGIESEVGKCGWQDQYAVTNGGINFIELTKGKIIAYPLKLKESVIRELESHMVLVFSKKSHDAKKIEKNNLQTMTKEKAEGLKKCAIAIRDLLLNEVVEPIGDILNQAWELKRNKYTSNEEIEELYKLGMTRGGASGGKVLGAGDGGYMLFFVEPKRKKYFIELFETMEFEVITPEITNKGAEVWSL